MGQDVLTNYYKDEDFDRFNEKLDEETKYLKNLFNENQFSSKGPSFGIELEGWIVDENMLPSPSASEFIEKLADPQIVPEISRFNFEINSSPQKMGEQCFSQLHSELNDLWAKCTKTMSQSKTSPLLMGTLATLRREMLQLDYMSGQNRYSVMNAQILKQRDNQPFKIHIEGKEKLQFEMDSVLAECAATSLQIHIKVSQEEAKRYYNASIIASPFMIAISANSPYLLGHELWDESRIAIFQQAVSVPCYVSERGNLIERVTLGEDYISESLFELFEQNQQRFDVLLPEISDDEVEMMGHLKLHNGTIWRWNRPIIGEDQDGSPHLRIEHRTPSAGPTIIDSVANSMFYIGFVHYLSRLETAPEYLIEFEKVIENFYKASKQSFYCKVHWLDGFEYDMKDILLKIIYPNSRQALIDQGVGMGDIVKYMDNVILKRIEKAQNGAVWQKAYIYKNGKCFQSMLEQYLEYQAKDIPIHQWEI